MTQMYTHKQIAQFVANLNEVEKRTGPTKETIKLRKQLNDYEKNLQRFDKADRLEATANILGFVGRLLGGR